VKDQEIPQGSNYNFLLFPPVKKKFLNTKGREDFKEYVANVVNNNILLVCQLKCWNKFFYAWKNIFLVWKCFWGAGLMLLHEKLLIAIFSYPRFKTSIYIDYKNSLTLQRIPFQNINFKKNYFPFWKKKYQMWGLKLHSLKTIFFALLKTWLNFKQTQLIQP